MFTTELTDFKPLTEDEVKSIMLKSPNKYCEVDPMPTNLFRKSINEIFLQQ